MPAGRARGRPRGSARRGSTRARAVPDVGQFKSYHDPDVGNAISPFDPSRPVGYHFGQPLLRNTMTKAVEFVSLFLRPK